MTKESIEYIATKVEQLRLIVETDGDVTGLSYDISRLNRSQIVTSPTEVITNSCIDKRSVGPSGDKLGFAVANCDRKMSQYCNNLVLQ